MSVWTALTRVAARLGLERILRRILQLFTWVLAPLARSAPAGVGGSAKANLL